MTRMQTTRMNTDFCKFNQRKSAFENPRYPRANLHIFSGKTMRVLMEKHDGDVVIHTIFTNSKF